MKEVHDQMSKPAGQSTTVITIVEGNVPANAPRPTVNQNTEGYRLLLPPPELSKGKKGKGIFNSPDQLVRESEDDTDRSSDLGYRDSHRLNREVLHFKKVFDDMWLQNTDFICTKTNLKKEV